MKPGQARSCSGDGLGIAQQVSHHVVPARRELQAEVVLLQAVGTTMEMELFVAIARRG